RHVVPVGEAADLRAARRQVPGHDRLRARDPDAPPAARRPLRRAPAPGRGARMRGRLVQLAGPVLLLALVGFWGSFLSNARAIEFEHALVFTAIVVALYVFIGNSGVISFGQIGFFLVGAYAAGELSIPAETKSSILPNVYGLIREHSVGNFSALMIAAGGCGLVPFLLGSALMRLSGLAAGIATFAVLEITQNILGNWESI